MWYHMLTCRRMLCIGTAVVACLATTDSSAQLCCPEWSVLSSPVRKNPTLSDRRSAIKTILMAPPMVDMYELSAGGVREAADEWSKLARNNVAIAIENELREKWDLVLKNLSA